MGPASREIKPELLSLSVGLQQERTWDSLQAELASLQLEGGLPFRGRTEAVARAAREMMATMYFILTWFGCFNSL
jgi:hypothetical protein